MFLTKFDFIQTLIKIFKLFLILPITFSFHHKLGNQYMYVRNRIPRFSKVPPWYSSYIVSPVTKSHTNG